MQGKGRFEELDARALAWWRRHDHIWGHGDKVFGGLCLGIGFGMLPSALVVLALEDLWAGVQIGVSGLFMCYLGWIL